MKKFYFTLIFAMFPVVALAETVVETQQWWQNLLVQIISFVAAVAAPVLSVLAVSLLRKWGVQMDREKLEWIAEKAIGYGEQKAKSALKHGSPLEGPEVLKLALVQADIMVKTFKADKKLALYLEGLIEAALGQQVFAQGGANASVPVPVPTDPVPADPVPTDPVPADPIPTDT